MLKKIKVKVQKSEVKQNHLRTRQYYTIAQ